MDPIVKNDLINEIVRAQDALQAMLDSIDSNDVDLLVDKWQDFDDAANRLNELGEKV